MISHESLGPGKEHQLWEDSIQIRNGKCSSAVDTKYVAQGQVQMVACVGSTTAGVIGMPGWGVM